MAEAELNGQPMEQDPSVATSAGLPTALQPSPYVTPEHFTSLKYFQVGENGYLCHLASRATVDGPTPMNVCRRSLEIGHVPFQKLCVV